MSVHTRVGMQWLMPVTYSEAQNKGKYSYPQLGTCTLFGFFFWNNRHLNYARIMRE